MQQYLRDKIPETILFLLLIKIIIVQKLSQLRCRSMHAWELLNSQLEFVFQKLWILKLNGLNTLSNHFLSFKWLQVCSPVWKKLDQGTVSYMLKSWNLWHTKTCAINVGPRLIITSFSVNQPPCKDLVSIKILCYFAY